MSARVAVDGVLLIGRQGAGYLSFSLNPFERPIPLQPHPRPVMRVAARCGKNGDWNDEDVRWDEDA